MWQFWQRGCWKTCRTVSKAARPAAASGGGAAPLLAAAAITSTAARSPTARARWVRRIVGMADSSRSGQPQRQPAQALARGGEDGVGHRGRYGRHAGLADSAGPLRARDDVHLDRRRLVHPQRRVIVEVRLLHLALAQRDRVVQRRRT